MVETTIWYFSNPTTIWILNPSWASNEPSSLVDNKKNLVIIPHGFQAILSLSVLRFTASTLIDTWGFEQDMSTLLTPNALLQQDDRALFANYLSSRETSHWLDTLDTESHIRIAEYLK